MKTPEEIAALLKSYIDARVEADVAKAPAAAPPRDILFEHLTAPEQAAVIDLLALIVDHDPKACDLTAQSQAVAIYRSGVGEILNRLHDDATLPHPSGGAEIPRKAVRIMPCEILWVEA